MELKCKSCGHTETVNKRFFLKALGVVFSGGGFWAWVAYIFAGTGFALPLCIAIVIGGAGLAAFADDIALWASKKFPCPKCGKKDWKAEA